MLISAYLTGSMSAMDSKWLQWAKKLQAIAQSGLTYAKDPFDIERYASVRRLAAEIMAAHSSGDPDYVQDLFAGEVGYATPKVDIRGVVMRGESMLLVKETEDSCWTLPGGWVDVGETPSEAVVREVYEESGYHTRAVRLLALWDRNKHDHPPFPYHVYKIYLQCEVLRADPDPLRSIETNEVGFFDEDAVPELSRTRVTPNQITRLFEYARNPNLPAGFD